MTPHDYRIIGLAVTFALLMGCIPYVLEYRIKNWRLHYLPDLTKLKELERQVVALQFQVLYLQTAPIKTEKVSYGANGHYNNQFKFEILDDQKTADVIVPYNIEREGVRYHYNTIWKPQDWRAMQQEKMWIERRFKKDGKAIYKTMWIKPEDFNKETDVDLTKESPFLDEDYIESELPCQWEYLGSEAI